MAPTTMKHLGPITIAYVDPHISVRKGIVLLLGQQENVKVIVEANGGKELIQLLKKIQKVPDICILEVNLPELDGFDTLVEIKKNWPEMKSLIFTSHGSQSYIHRMILNGANGYLLKNCRPDEIYKAIYSMYTDGMYFSDSISRNFLHAVQNGRVQPPELTEREKQFLKYCCTDLSYQDVADKMQTSKKSIEGYRDRLFKKLNVNSRVGLTIFAIQHGFYLVEE